MRRIVEALKSSDRTDHLQMNVSGDVEGGTIQLSSVKPASVFSEDAPSSILRGWGICLGMLMVGLEDDLQCELRVEGLAGSDGGVT